jgi:excisionase family DNA binding protein
VDDDDLLTVEEVAERTGLSVATVRRRAAQGSMAAEKVGRQWLIRASRVPKGRSQPRGGPTLPAVDLTKSLRELEHRDLVDVWVPDILAFEDMLADRASVMSEASMRLWNSGPFEAVVEVEVPKTPFFSRPASMPTLPDRLAYHAAVGSFAERVDGLLSERVYSARLSKDPDHLLLNGRDQWLRWNQAVIDSLDAGFLWMVKSDVTAYFDNIEHRLLFGDIDALNPDPRIASALKRMLGSWASVPGRGLPQGSDVSRVLGNLYLVPVDDAMRTGDWSYFRYMDDFRVLGRSRAEVQAGVRVLERECRKRGLTLSTHKTALLVGTAAKADLEESELDEAQYWMDIGNDAEARRRLRNILKSSLARVGNLDDRRARFSLWRLWRLRDHHEMGRVLENIERLGPVAPIVVQYLRPFLSRKRVQNGVEAFLMDRERNTSSFVSTWLLGLLIESQSNSRAVLAYARDICINRNEPAFHRAVAASVLALGGRPSDISWLRSALGTEYDPSIIRAFLVALARVSALTRDAQRLAVTRWPEAERTVQYLGGRTSLPSLVYRTTRVPVR